MLLNSFINYLIKQNGPTKNSINQIFRNEII